MADDANEGSAAMLGSVEPVAYQAVDEYGRPFGYAQIILPFGKWPKSQRVALYLQPQFALTDEEVEAVEWCIFQQAVPQRLAVTMRALLERLK